VHLEAALEVWRYCAESAAYVFGDRTGDKTADHILAALKTGPLGRTKISELFGRNKSKDALDAALAMLAGAGLAHCVHTSEGKSHTEVWHAGRALKGGSDGE